MDAKTKEALESMQRMHAAIEQLVNSDGWKLFEVTFKASREESYGLMLKADNAQQAAVQLGAYHTARAVLNWPERQLRLLEANIQQILAEDSR
jgi:hypothetical protein